MLVIPKIRLATEADSRFIAEMSRDYIEQGLGWSWTQARVLRAIRDRATNVAVIDGRAGPSGFGVMHYGDTSAHLALLAVLPSQQRRGLGCLLLSWLEKSAVTAGIGIVRVEAREDNSRAIAFYQKHGYTPRATTPGYYRGVLDAVRMEKTLLELTSL
jgi:ribosomal protein S18 acetylase RimI-like enzyme